MDDSRVLRGTELRYALTMYLAQHGPCFVGAGYPPKSVSDALRWERGHARVIKRGRGVYRVSNSLEGGQFGTYTRRRRVIPRAVQL